MTLWHASTDLRLTAAGLTAATTVAAEGAESLKLTGYASGAKVEAGLGLDSSG